ncbi:MAG: YeeE/YedE family protein [Polyangiales bacterium]
MENFTPIASTLGGLLIGVASAMVLVFNGRIAGISGVSGGIFRFEKGDLLWRSLFVGGLVLGGLAAYLVAPAAFEIATGRPLWVLAIAGLLTGVGTQLGGGCTSGHGICGLGRFSMRSLVAVLTFLLTAAITVAVYGGPS